MTDVYEIPLSEKERYARLLSNVPIINAGATFRWIAGPNAGKVAKFKEFVESEDGSEIVAVMSNGRCSASKFNELLVQDGESFEIADEARFDDHYNPKRHVHYATEPVVYKDNNVPQKLNLESIRQEPVKVQHPVESLLSTSKRRETKDLVITLSLELPTKELVSVLLESYEDAGNVIVEYITKSMKDKLVEASQKALVDVLSLEFGISKVVEDI
jgi:hypothetical protein